MKNLIKKMISEALNIKKIGEGLVDKYKELEPDEKKIVTHPFVVFHNNLILCIEVLDNWLEQWDNPSKSKMHKINGKSLKPLTEKEIAVINKENFERVMGLLRWSLFLPTFSLIEFSMKQVLFLYSNHPAAEKVIQLKEKPYLIGFKKSILDPAEKSQIITKDQAKEWLTLAQLRNSVVHNNAISQMDLRYKGNKYNLNFKKGEMLWNKLDIFLYCSLALIRLYYAWVDNLLQSTEKKPDVLTIN